MTPSRRLVVLGGGFIGSEVAAIASRFGQTAVVYGRDTGHELSDPDRVRRLVKPGDQVLLTAWSGSAEPGIAALRLRANLVTTVAIGRACRERDVARVVFLSSGGTIYGSRLRASEDTAPQPVSPMGEGKLLGEQLLHTLVGSRLVITRLGNVYGPRQLPSRPGSLIATVVDCLRRHRTFTLWGQLTDRRDYLHVDDAVVALWAIVTSRRPRSSTYNVGSGRTTTTARVIELCERYTGRRLQVRRVEPRGVSTSYISLACQRLHDEFGWRPRVGIVAGIRSVIATHEGSGASDQVRGPSGSR